MQARPRTSSHLEGPIRFGEFSLDPVNRELLRDGERVRLQIQPFQLLALLLARAGTVVTREELRQRLWPSSIYVDFDHGLNNAIARVREALGDSASAPRYVETLPRHGYRFIHPLEAAPLQEAEPAAAPPDTSTAAEDIPPEIAAAPGPQMAPEPPPHPGESQPLGGPVPAKSQGPSARTLGASALLVVAAIAALSWLLLRDPLSAPPTVRNSGSPSIAVLPFTSLGAEEDREQFADALTGELRNKLAGIPGVRVAGRTSSSLFKGKQADLPTVARALNVQHVLEGSVQRSGNRLRISAELVNVTDGTQVWSRSFDRNMTDIFQIQEDIAFAVATALQIKLFDSDRARLQKRGTTDAEAYRLYALGLAHATGLTVTRDRGLARRLYQEAIARDPGFAAPYAGIARIHFVLAFSDLNGIEDNMRLGLAAAAKAIALDPESSDALVMRANLGMLRYRFLDDFEAVTQAHADYRRGIQLDPTNELHLFDYGRSILWLQPELTVDLMRQAQAIEPLMIVALGTAAGALNILGRREAVLQTMAEAARKQFAGDNSSRSIPYQSSIAEQQGRLAESLSLRERSPEVGPGAALNLWATRMSLGNREQALDSFSRASDPLGQTLREAAKFSMNGDAARAYRVLEDRRGSYPLSQILDVPTARLALRVGDAAAARQILERRFPDLVAGIGFLNNRNVMPALDLALAHRLLGRDAQAREWLARIGAFLDGPQSAQLPLFQFLRARTHAIAGERAQALDALDRAFEAGFRTLWAPDLHPQPLLYLDAVEADPAFDSLRSDTRYQSWLLRTRDDNARQLAQYRAGAGA